MVDRLHMPAPDRQHALYAHCVEVYNAMLAESEPYELREGVRPPPMPQVVGGPIVASRGKPWSPASAGQNRPGAARAGPDGSPPQPPSPEPPPSSLAPVADQEGPRIYTGYLTKLFRSLHLAVPYYTSVMDNLKRMKCVEQLKRGGGSRPSQWALWHPPDRMLFNYMQTEHKLQADGTHKRTIHQILEQRINDLDTELKRQTLRINQLEMQLEREGA